MTRVKPASTSKKGVGRKPKVIEHPLSSDTEFTNREIGWLNFNRRVFHESEGSTKSHFRTAAFSFDRQFQSG